MYSFPLPRAKLNVFGQFQKATFTQVYKKEKFSFDVYYRDLLPWMLSLIADPILAPHLRWDASKLFKRRPDGKWMRYVHEPWTGDLWWKLQVCYMDGMLRYAHSDLFNSHYYQLAAVVYSWRFTQTKHVYLPWAMCKDIRSWESY